MNRKELHNDFEKNMLCSTLPNLFLSDVESKVKNHFVKQLLSNKILPLTIEAVPSASKAFSRWLINAPTEDVSVASDLHDDNMHLPSLMSLITKDASLENIKKKYFF